MSNICIYLLILLMYFLGGDGVVNGWVGIGVILSAVICLYNYITILSITITCRILVGKPNFVLSQIPCAIIYTYP